MFYHSTRRKGSTFHFLPSPRTQHSCKHKQNQQPHFIALSDWSGLVRYVYICISRKRCTKWILAIAELRHSICPWVPVILMGVTPGHWGWSSPGTALGEDSAGHPSSESLTSLGQNDSGDKDTCSLANGLTWGTDPSSFSDSVLLLADEELKCGSNCVM